LTIHQLKGLPSALNGHEIVIECKRGSKTKNHASTQKITAAGSSITFEEKLKFYCTFFEDPKTKKFDQKKKDLTFTIKEVDYLCVMAIAITIVRNPRIRRKKVEYLVKVLST
jgi:hypothetical protein